jgi:AcrR family transcriptional regulator
MPAGRPREFDLDQVLDRAVEVFWRQGYEGTALSDLTEAMGINRPSLYAAYGNKEQLFAKVLARYAENNTTYVRTALDQPTARAAVAALLTGIAQSTTRPGRPRGCLTVQAALACGEANESVRLALNTHRAGMEVALRRRLIRARHDGDLPPDADPADLAKFVCTVFQGIAVQASAGATRRQLMRVADVAVATIPADPARVDG